MDYKQLQFFLAVCEAQSFRNAAARCYVSQQAISKSLSNLEQELGVQLFVRNQNGVSLTEAGQQLEKLARPHLNQRDEILRQMRSFHSKQQLHIGYFMGFLQELLVHIFNTNLHQILKTVPLDAPVVLDGSKRPVQYQPGLDIFIYQFCERQESIVRFLLLRLIRKLFFLLQHELRCFKIHLFFGSAGNRLIDSFHFLLTVFLQDGGTVRIVHRL
jgi:DNA-binding transcriptional LysR family regulator